MQFSFKISSNLAHYQANLHGWTYYLYKIKEYHNIIFHKY